MKAISLLAVVAVCCIAGCGDGQQSEPPQAAKPAMPAPQPPAETMAEKGTEALANHMHKHAEQLERLNQALEAGDLDAAQSPAYWLSRHEGASGIADSWRPHLETIREGARAVETAPDIAAARSAAQRIAEGCNDCHSAAGVDAVISRAGDNPQGM